jgi:hypothetical protein
VAGSQALSPGWEAVIVHVPGARVATLSVPWATVHTPDVPDWKETGSPDEAVADTVNDAPAFTPLDSGPKLIVCLFGKDTTLDVGPESLALFWAATAK